MNDIINYFIGAFENLFTYCDPIWHVNPELKLAFIIIVSCFCAITLFMGMSILKHAFIAVFNAIRRQ